MKIFVEIKVKSNCRHYPIMMIFHKIKINITINSKNGKKTKTNLETF